jgi:hypothetical protein
MRAATAVLWLAPEKWLDAPQWEAIVVHPGDIIERVYRSHLNTGWESIC